MACEKCQINPEAHSFTPFGQLNGANLFYTSPARVLDYMESEEKIFNFKKHLDVARPNNWIWVFDCAFMQMKHFSTLNYTRRLANILVSEHENTLQAILIIRPNTWIRSVLKFLKTLFKSPLLNKVQIIEGEKLELYVNLEKKGLNGKPLQWISSVLTLKPDQQLPILSN
jgi:hypothetical protein